jgi:hypothetical protein
MKQLLLIFFIICFYNSFSQPPGIIRVKNKNGRTIKMFFVDDHITFETIDGILRNGVIKNIKNDSIYITTFNIKTLINYWGGNYIDTLNRFSDGFNYKDIKRILIKTRLDIPITHLAKPMQAGGLFYIFLNVVNSVHFHDSFTGSGNLIKVGVAAMVSATGFIIEKVFHTDKFSKKTDIIELI